MFGAIASVLGNMFGTQKAGERIVDGAISALDKMVYTDEEKAEARAQQRDKVMAAYMTWLESTSGSRLARRMLAAIVTIPWASAHTAAWILKAAAPFADGVVKYQTAVDGVVRDVVISRAEQFMQAAHSLAVDASANNELIGVVLLFYFGGPVAAEVGGKLVTQWVDRSAKRTGATQ